MADIGFIGLGNMGGGMAANLARGGQVVRAFDLSADALAKAADAGCTPAADARAAAEGAGAVVTMLPSGSHVEQVHDLIREVVQAGAILIDCSTIDVDTAKRNGVRAQEAGLLCVDAPVSGGIAAANAGTLTFMVGGSEEAFACAHPYLAVMGGNVVHAGERGAGQSAKICNNMLLGAEMVATCEAFVLAEKLGLGAQRFFDIASVSSGQSWSMTSYCPVPGVGPETPADRGFQGGFAAALMLKDLRLAMAAAGQVKANTPMGERATELYERYVDALDGDASDFSGIIRMFAAGAGGATRHG
jgi:3-hydroxyisobutyrate dehydrogenase